MKILQSATSQKSILQSRAILKCIIRVHFSGKQKVIHAFPYDRLYDIAHRCTVLLPKNPFKGHKICLIFDGLYEFLNSKLTLFVVPRIDQSPMISALSLTSLSSTTRCDTKNDFYRHDSFLYVKIRLSSLIK